MRLLVEERPVVIFNFRWRGDQKVLGFQSKGAL
jgi:hypothetical protein